MLMWCLADDGARDELRHGSNPQVTSQQGQLKQEAQLFQARSTKGETSAALVNMLTLH